MRPTTTRTRFALVATVLVLSIGCRQEAGVDARVQTAISGITNRSVRAHVDKLVAIGPRPSNDSDASEKAVAYISDRLLDYGYIVDEEQFRATSRYDGSTVIHRNLFARLVGKDEPARILEIGAHYDTVVGSPGADDNASGVAGVLEIARVLSARQYDKTLRFCFFAMEEDGLLGSRYHVAKIREKGERVEGIVVLEMIGYTSSAPGSQKSPVRIPILFDPPKVGNYLCVVGNFPSGGLGGVFESAARRYVPSLGYYSVKRLGGLFRDASRSDHSPYWDAGMRGVMLTDTANFRNPHYHRKTDTIDTLDFGFLARSARATAAAAGEWAGIR